MRDAGAGPLHEHRILRLWSHALPRDSGRRRPDTFFPSSLLAALPAIEAELAGLARIQAVHPGADGSERLLPPQSGHSSLTCWKRNVLTAFMRLDFTMALSTHCDHWELPK